MVKVSLSGAGGPLTVALDDDCHPSETLEDGFPTLVVRKRTRTGYDNDGNPQLTWQTLVEGRTIVWEKREEFDAEAGVTLVTAVATLAYDGEQIPETAVVIDSDEVLWRIVSAEHGGGRVTFKLRRLDDG